MRLPRNVGVNPDQETGQDERSRFSTVTKLSSIQNSGSIIELADNDLQWNSARSKRFTQLDYSQINTPHH